MLVRLPLPTDAVSREHNRACLSVSILKKKKMKSNCFLNSASCRRPIRGAAGRPLKPTEYWLNESNVQRTVLTESRSYSESLSRGASVVSSKKAPARRGLPSLLLKLLVLVVVAVSLYYAYQNLDAGHIDTLKGLLDSVVVPLQGVVNNAADYLGIGGSSAAKTGK